MEPIILLIGWHLEQTGWVGNTATFGLRYIDESSNGLSGGALFSGSGRTYQNEKKLRPIVTLPSSVVIGSSGKGTSDSPWGIK